jgi:hypothetical protein
MRHLVLIALAAAAAAVLAGSHPASAQPNRTFVSGQGTDSGGCAITAPCRSFAYAITATSVGGEIAVLNTAGYGAVTINKAISITNEEGVEAGITVSSGDGITIAAGTGDVVNLRGLTLIGGGVGNNGITFTSGGTLNIQNTVIGGFTSNGLNLKPSGSSTFNVSDTIVANNQNGVLLAPTGSNTTVQGFFERVQALGNSSGFEVDGTNATSGTTIQATAADCAASGNSGPGFDVVGSGSTTKPTFMVVNGKAVNNTMGVVANDATMIIAQTTIYGNFEDGFDIVNTGTIKSFLNNYIADTTNVGTLTTIGQR